MKNQMKRLYEIINECGINDKNVMATVIEGEHFGEKALFSADKLLFESSDGGFLGKHQQSILEKKQTGTYWIDDNRVFVEILGNDEKLVVCGGGHVAIQLIKIALMIGFKVIAIEDRPTFADNARRAGANHVICKPFEEALEEIEGDKDTFFVIVTRGHRFDKICLEKIIEKENAYVGMMGSKVRVRTIKEELREKGIDKEIIDSIYAPIGLKIGAETPEEIAVCIAAELIQVKNSAKRGSRYTKEMLEAILADNDENAAKVLVTIVSKKGSTPRSAGTKMLVFPNGKTIGTIGGGCVEADIIQKSLSLMDSNSTEPELYKVDMLGQNAEDEGMVCGGINEVLLEKIE